jgi:four helix bundle protein
MTFEMPFQKMRVYRLAKDLAVLVQRAAIRDLELCDQATRAAKSCFLNIAEGLPSDQPLVRRRHLCIAKGSVCETAAAIDLCLALGLLDHEASKPMLEIAVELKRMLSAMAR